MSPSDHKRVFRRLIDEAFNGGCLAVLDEVLTANFADHSPCRQEGGADALRERIALLRGAMPDLHVCVDDLAAAGDMTWAAVTVRGTGHGVRGKAGSRRVPRLQPHRDLPLRRWADRGVLERDGRPDGAAGDHRYLADSNSRLTRRPTDLYTGDLRLLSL